jgi:uncharacterized protein (DUF362 family)
MSKIILQNFTVDDIAIIYGTDATEMTYALLRETVFSNRLTPGMNVVIKPNLVVAKPASEGATTHLEVVEGIVLFLKDCGIKSPVIAEGSWLGETTNRAFDCCGFTVLAKKHGVKLFDTKTDNVIKKTAHGLTLGVCETIVNADFLINVPVLKGHCQTTLTCCLKNMKGCIPDSEKRRYHNIGLHKPIAALNTILKPALHVIDGICGDPTFEEGGKPVVANRVLVGTDPVLLDSYGAALLGYAPASIDYLRYAVEYGIGKMFDSDTTVRELQVENRPKTSPTGQGDLVRRLAKHIDEQSACSACYAALIFALNNLTSTLGRDKIKIGQGFRGKKCSGLGIGNCTADCERHVPGCPPTAADIIKELAKG